MGEVDCRTENGNQNCRKVINFLVSSFLSSSESHQSHVPYGTTCQDNTILKIFKDTIYHICWYRTARECHAYKIDGCTVAANVFVFFFYPICFSP